MNENDVYDPELRAKIESLKIYDAKKTVEKGVSGSANGAIGAIAALLTFVIIKKNPDLPADLVGSAVEYGVSIGVGAIVTGAKIAWDNWMKWKARKG